MSNRVARAPPPDSARSLIQAFERYYITVAALVKSGPGAMTATQLEKVCTLTAQRLGLLNELAAPEFFDKALFCGFIHKLRERRVVWTDDEGKLDYAAALEQMVDDAKVILSREVRHSILKITPGGDGGDAAAEGKALPATLAAAESGEDAAAQADDPRGR